MGSSLDNWRLLAVADPVPWENTSQRRLGGDLNECVTGGEELKGISLNLWARTFCFGWRQGHMGGGGIG